VVDEDNLDVVTSVNVTLSDRVDDILACVLGLFLVGWQHFDFEVMAVELVVEDWATELHTGALGTVSHLIVGADSIVAEDGTFTVLVETAEQVECVVWHESSAVESDRQELGNALCGWLTSVLHNIGANACDQVLVKGLNVRYHTSRGNDALGSQLGSL